MSLSISTFITFLNSFIIRHKVVILYLEYDRGKYPDSYSELKKHLRKLANCEKSIIRIDNKIENPVLNINYDSAVMINGDNSSWEFSGWQKGLDYIKKNNLKYDAVLFVNDSFLIYGSNPISSILRPWILSKCISLKSIAGIVDHSDKTMELNMLDVTKYVRTNCFFVAEPIIAGLNSICSVEYKSMDRYIPAEPDENIFCSDAPLNKSLQNEILKWLSDEWHSKFNILENWEFFRRKTCAILNEKMLTAIVVERGYKILEVGEYRSFKDRCNYIVHKFYRKDKYLF